MRGEWQPGITAAPDDDEFFSATPFSSVVGALRTIRTTSDILSMILLECLAKRHSTGRGDNGLIYYQDVVLPRDWISFNIPAFRSLRHTNDLRHRDPQVSRHDVSKPSCHDTNHGSRPVLQHFRSFSAAICTHLPVCSSGLLTIFESRSKSPHDRFWGPRHLRRIHRHRGRCYHRTVPQPLLLPVAQTRRKPGKSLKCREGAVLLSLQSN